MIDGITILNETIKFTADWKDLIFAIIILVTTIFFLVLALYAFKDKFAGIGVMILIFTLAFGFSSFVGFYVYFNKTEYKEYQVTIDDSVKMNEFNQRYEIRDQEGKIYTIVEKEDSN